ncbi:MAG: UDP-N-acetylmuramate--L-alanine ligase [Saccharofermentanales bacterium]
MENTQTTAPLFGLRRGDRIFFTGIGGYSMCGLARICYEKGYIIAGSDKEISHRTRQLEDLGVRIYYGHSGSSIEEFNPQCLVYSVAVPLSNPELIMAARMNIQIIERSYFLGGIDRIFSRVINIAGTHGKTTTTTLCALMLEESGLDPTAHIGAEVSSWDSTVRIGKNSDLFVSEACEYNSSFLRFYSTTAAILNIDHDHIDCFPTIEDVVDAFVRFADLLPAEGFLVIPSFDPNTPLLLRLLTRMRIDEGKEMPKIITFGREFDLSGGNKPDFYCSDYKTINGYPDFDVYHGRKFVCHARLVIPGEYNAMNALAAIACSVLNGADPEACARVLSQFYGADNRFSLRGEYLGAKVISDYAHHPSAITAAYQAAVNVCTGDVWVVFQPITYNRVIGLFREFVQALSACRFSMLFEVYTSRETDNKGFSSRLICNEIVAGGGSSTFISSFAELKETLDGRVRTGDLILFMGPEGMEEYADMLVENQGVTA